MTSKLRKWQIRNANMNEYNVNYNVKEFEEETYNKMVEDQRIEEGHGQKRDGGETIDIVFERNDAEGNYEEQEIESLMSWNEEGSEMTISNDESIDFLDLDRSIPMPKKHQIAKTYLRTKLYWNTLRIRTAHSSQAAMVAT
jgi:hypothetical protein